MDIKPKVKSILFLPQILNNRKIQTRKSNIPFSPMSGTFRLPVALTPLYPCTVVPLHRHTFVPLHLCTPAPLYPCTIVPLYRCTIVPLYPCTFPKYLFDFDIVLL
jgi:hypothetical protein